MSSFGFLMYVKFTKDQEYKPRVLAKINKYPLIPNACALCFCLDYPRPFSSPEPTIFLACGRDQELWLGLTTEVRDSRTSHQIWLVENTIRMLCAYSENRVRPELSIPATGQKDRGLWGRECVRLRYVTEINWESRTGTRQGFKANAQDYCGLNLIPTLTSSSSGRGGKSITWRSLWSSLILTEFRP